MAGESKNLSQNGVSSLVRQLPGLGTRDLPVPAGACGHRGTRGPRPPRPPRPPGRPSASGACRAPGLPAAATGPCGAWEGPSGSRAQVGCANLGRRGCDEDLLEFHKSCLSPRVIFFFNLPQLAACSSRGPAPLFQHIPLPGSVYTGPGLPGSSPPLAAPAAAAAEPVRGREEQSRPQSPPAAAAAAFPSMHGLPQALPQALPQGASSRQDPSARGCSSWHSPPLIGATDTLPPAGGEACLRDESPLEGRPALCKKASVVLSPRGSAGCRAPSASPEPGDRPLWPLGGPLGCGRKGKQWPLWGCSVCR